MLARISLFSLQIVRHEVLVPLHLVPSGLRERVRRVNERVLHIVRSQLITVVGRICLQSLTVRRSENVFVGTRKIWVTERLERIVVLDRQLVRVRLRHGRPVARLDDAVGRVRMMIHLILQIVGLIVAIVLRRFQILGESVIKRLGVAADALVATFTEALSMRLCEGIGVLEFTHGSMHISFLTNILLPQLSIIVVAHGAAILKRSHYSYRF